MSRNHLQRMQGPERSREPEHGQNRLRLADRLGAPVRVEDAPEPAATQGCDLIEIEDRAALTARRRQPAREVIFRPEGEDGASSEIDVVPPVPGGDDKVNQTLPIQIQRLVAVGALELDLRRRPEQCGEAKHVPGAVGIIGGPPGADHERGG